MISEEPHIVPGASCCSKYAVINFLKVGLMKFNFYVVQMCSAYHTSLTCRRPWVEAPEEHTSSILAARELQPHT